MSTTEKKKVHNENESDSLVHKDSDNWQRLSFFLHMSPLRPFHMSPLTLIGLSPAPLNIKSI